MTDTAISIPVDAETARVYGAMSVEEQKKVQVLLNLQIQDLLSNPAISLSKVMDEIGANAKARGLTPEILETILRED